MASQVVAVMKNPQDIDHRPAPPAIDHKMPGITHNTKRGPGPIATKTQMISPYISGEVWPLLRTGALGIGLDITQRLHQQSFIPDRGVFAKRLFGPLPNGDNISPRCGGENGS